MTRRQRELLQQSKSNVHAQPRSGALRAWAGVFALALLALVLIGRQALIPVEAGARADSISRTQVGAAPAEIASPFAPWGADAGNADALVAGIRLIGLRVSADAVRSGAVFTLADGIERAFIVGQEISPGVRLNAVGVDHVVLIVRGGQMHTLSLEQGERRLIDTASRAAHQTAPPGESASAWLAATLARPEESMGPSPGWRVRPPLPQVAAEAGLQVGDLITAINGASPGDASAARAASQHQLIQLSVMHSSGERVTLWFPRNAQSPTAP